MNMDPNLLKTNYIWTPDWTGADDSEPRIVYFRKTFFIPEGEVPANKRIRITADSRYKLYVNGCFVQEGPQKALGLREWFVDTADLAPFLREGENVAAAEVLRYPAPTFSPSNPKTNDSLYRTEIPCLYVEDADGPGKPVSVTVAGKTGWKCLVNRGIRIFGEEERPAPIHVQENVRGQADLQGWKSVGFDDSAWKDAAMKRVFDIPLSDAPGCLVDRTIPPQRHTDKHFENAVCLRDPAAISWKINKARLHAALGAGYALEAAENAAREIVGILPLLPNGDDPEKLCGWNGLLREDAPLTIPAHAVQMVEISAGVEECGYLLYAFAGGKGAVVETLCSEAYAYPPEEKEDSLVPSAPVKGDRTDYKNGRLYGSTSRYEVAGKGTHADPETYEPYWFRTFRYIRLTITTGEEPLVIMRFSYRETGYPLDVKTNFTASDESFAPIWDISVRTLKRCMHETYFDCPFYEQLQYAMDGRSEILYTYALSADDRLARQAMEAFRLSQRPDGMTNSDAPTVKGNPIPAFSIYYLMMVHDHMMYFGDKALVRKHLPAIDGILNFFDSHLAGDGIVGHVGGPIMRDRYWSFIDWSTKWNEFGGVPNAIAKGTGSLTMESLLYLYGLQNAAELAAFVGRDGLAKEYLSRAEVLKEAIRRKCFGTWTDEAGCGHALLQDGPGVEDYSVHCQVFGILTGVVTAEEGREMLRVSVGNEAFAQSSVSFMFYLFRAMEMAGCYEMTDRRWDLWRGMLRDHMTTCVENDTDARSDCHAWASLICYEMPAVMLGVRPAAPGFSKIHLAPQMGALTSASGDVITPKGMVHVVWKKAEDGSCALTYTLPDGIEAI